MRSRSVIALSLAALTACSTTSSTPASGQVPPDDLLDAALPPPDGAASPRDDANDGIVPCAWDTTPLDRCTWR